MQILGKTFVILIVLILVGGLLIGGYFGVKQLAALFSQLDFQVAMASAIGALALLLAATIVASGIRHAGTRVRDAQLHSVKAEAYREFIEFWEGLLESGKDPEEWDTFSPEMQEVTHLLVLHGSTAVLKFHSELRDLALPDARELFADALIQIRSDLGLQSRDLHTQDLLDLLLTESDNEPEPVFRNEKQNSKR